MRVIAGSARGLRLVAPPGTATRPTTDRVRESVFSALETRLGGFDDLTVLDLFAGTGAMAIEALSRGAARALAVDRDRAAATAVRANLASTRLAARARVTEGEARALVNGGAVPEAPFDVVFLDPPYDAEPDLVTDVLTALAAPAWTAPNAVAVVEHRQAAGGPGTVVLPAGWRSEWERRYGATLVVFAARDES